MPHPGLELRSTITAAGQLTLSLEQVDVGDPGAGEVVVRMEAAPINPSDLGLLVGPADVSTMTAGGTAERPELRFTVPANRLGSVKARLDESMAVGNEGAGTVIAAGDGAEAMMGKRVAVLGGAMYTQFRKLKARDCVPLPDGATSADGAAMFVNPLTALGFTETMKAEGHSAIVHTAAASNLGQMLNRICIADGIPLVNIVRSPAQVALLEGQGAKYVLDSSAEGFGDKLVDALAETKASIGFDAIGGGDLVGRILDAMEKAANRQAGEYSRYGSNTFKQMYLYGMLDVAPTVIRRTFGFAWSIGGWLLTPFLQKAGAETGAKLRQRVLDELKTTFASNYTATIGLAEALKPETFLAYERKTTGEKYLIDPTMMG